MEKRKGYEGLKLYGGELYYGDIKLNNVKRINCVAAADTPVGTLTVRPVATSDISKLVDGEIWEFSERATAELGPLVPTDKEMHDHLLRYLRGHAAMTGVDVMRAKNQRHVVLPAASGNPLGCAHDFRKLFAKAVVYRDDVFGNTDNVRREFFVAAEKTADAIAEQVAAYRAVVGRPVLRFRFDHAIQRCAAYDSESRFVAYSMVSDVYQVRFRSGFAITPPGEELSEQP